MNRNGTFTTLAACAALALSGCADSTRDLYEGEQTEADVLPEDVAVEGETAQQVVKLLRWLEDMDDVQSVYSNAQLGDEAYG